METRDFSGLTAHVAKRRALNYWYQNRDDLGLSLSEFLGRCRVSTRGRATHITFYRAAS